MGKLTPDGKPIRTARGGGANRPSKVDYVAPKLDGTPAGYGQTNTALIRDHAVYFEGFSRIERYAGRDTLAGKKNPDRDMISLKVHDHSLTENQNLKVKPREVGTIPITYRTLDKGPGMWKLPAIEGKTRIVDKGTPFERTITISGRLPIGRMTEEQTRNKVVSIQPNTLLQRGNPFSLKRLDRQSHNAKRITYNVDMDFMEYERNNPYPVSSTKTRLGLP